jgi:superfamily II DNA or RNA helicase
MAAIASQLPEQVIPRPEQFVLMYLIIGGMNRCSTTLLQLPTGTGKSLMFGLLARYINTHLRDELGSKVVVVVPNEVLVAIQQYKYSPWASKVGDELFRVNSDIHYCTYSDFLTGKIPHSTILLVDEIDSLVFADQPMLL